MRRRLAGIAVTRTLAVPWGARPVGAVACTRALRRSAGAAALASACLVFLSSVASASAGWSIQLTPNPTGTTHASPYAVSCSSATACTMVGFYETNSRGGILAERWNGTSWTIQPAPSPTGALYAVSCPTATACTAVGEYYSRSSSTYKTLAEQWNGTRWTIQPTPNPSGGVSLLNGVSCPSATDCTAVGNSSTHGTLAERWNGTRWTIQPTANPGGGPADLFAVSCPTAADCTAVGSTGTNQTLAERWNGTRWTIQPTPTVSASAYLHGVSCLSPDSCTAVGYYDQPQAPKALAERWNGTSWTIQPTPTPGGRSEPLLFSVSCPTATACTAVGYDQTASQLQPLAERWNGTTWSIQPAPNPPGSASARFVGVSCPVATACTAVGYYRPPGLVSDNTLAEHYLG
jgi:hypothetical protein